jgi:hypothetical protein
VAASRRASPTGMPLFGYQDPHEGSKCMQSKTHKARRNRRRTDEGLAKKTAHGRRGKTNAEPFVSENDAKPSLCGGASYCARQHYFKES